MSEEETAEASFPIERARGLRAAANGGHRERERNCATERIERASHICSRVERADELSKNKYPSADSARRSSITPAESDVPLRQPAGIVGHFM